MGKYQRSSARKKENNIIPMPLDANFFFERALHHLNRNDLSKALKYFWKIIDVEPNNPVHYCNLAGLLSEMGRFKESNELLMYVMEKLDPSLAECYYYMANNYAYLEEPELSFKYIHRYLEIDPKGEYVDEAKEMLAIISTEIDDVSLDHEEDNKELYLLHYKAKNSLEEGKFYDAIRKLKKLVEDHPSFIPAKNNLALAYFYIGNYVKAKDQTFEVLKLEDTNIHALCNLAIFYKQLDEQEEYYDILDFLGKVYPYQTEQAHKLATTFAILGEHELAFKHFIKLIKAEEMVNPIILHYGAISAFNIQRFDLAEKWWLKILRIEEDSEVAEFYLELSERLKGNGDVVFPNYCYQYELPFEQQINMLQLNPDQMKNNFTLESFILGLYFGDEKDKEQLILGLATFKSVRAESVLREFLLDENQPFRLKKKALIALEDMGAEPPYKMITAGKTYEMERQTPDFSLWKNNWIEVLELIEKKMSEKYNVIELYDAKTLWFEFISQTYPKTPQIRKIESWVAALEYFVAKMHRKPISFSKLAEKYNVSTQTISKHVNDFEEVLKLKSRLSLSM